MLVSQRPNIARLVVLTTQEHSPNRNVARGFLSRQDSVLRVVGQRALGGEPRETLPRENGLPEPTAKPAAPVEGEGRTQGSGLPVSTNGGRTGTGTQTTSDPTHRTNGAGAGTTTNNPANRTNGTVATTTVTTPVMGSAAANAALAKLREASVRLRDVDLADYNRDWARQMVESGTASNPAFYQLLDKAAAAIKEAYRKHLGREPTKDEMAMWLPFTPSMAANERQWAANEQRLLDRANLEQVAGIIAARTSSSTTPLTDAQINDFIRANIENPSAIATAMIQHNVSFARVQTTIGASAADIADYVASSNSDALKRLYAAEVATPAPTTPSTPTTPPTNPSPAVTDAQINDYIRANLQNPDAIAAAMVQYSVSMSRVQSVLGSTWDEIKAYVAASNNDTLKRLLVEAIGPG